jgi:hypothetical protein
MAKKLFIALVLILVLLLVAPIIFGAVTGFIGLPGLSGFNGVIPAAALIPLLFVAGGIVAVLVWVFSKKNNKDG